MPSPPLTINFNWTSAGNYPSGSQPWSSQPVAVAPVATLFTPNTKPPAENFNYILGQIATDLSNINTYLLHTPLPIVQQYSVTTTGIIVPSNSYWAGAVLWGGGGGGEGGCRGFTQTSSSTSDPDGYTAQGGGGAGAQMMTTFFQVNPGDALDVTVGAGGSGGAAGGGGGGDGGNSNILCIGGVFVGTQYAEAQGGSGCGAGIENYSGSSTTTALSDAGLYTDVFGICAPGAVGQAGAAQGFPFSTGPVALQGSNFLPNYIPQVPSRGGSVFAFLKPSFTTITRVSYGGLKAQGNVGNYGGGAPGTTGADNPFGSKAYWGGCGGGGGGAGPFGTGGAGGNGGVGGSGSAALPGSAPLGESGAGGGGGGCGGWGASGGSSPGLGGAGGAGGSGLVTLFFFGGPPAAP